MRTIKKIYLVPNFITSAALFSGFYSIIASIQKNYVLAAWAIIAAAVFDMMDGRVARLTKATSAFGVQYDSLSDLISFGAAPALLLYQWALFPYERLGWLAAFLFLACATLRLARFNVNVDSVSKKHFQGLPTTIAGVTVATYIIFDQTIQFTGYRDLFVLFFTFALASLMVSTIPFPSFKELNWKSKTSFGFLSIGVLGMILVAVKPEVTLFLVLSAYIVCSLAWNTILFFWPSFLQKKAHSKILGKEQMN